MMTLVTASIASGSKETIRRTPTFATTMRGDASQTIRKIGKVLRSAARRSFQRGTGLAICGCNCFIPENLSRKNYVPSVLHNDCLHPYLTTEAPKCSALLALHHMPRTKSHWG